MTNWLKFYNFEWNETNDLLEQIDYNKSTDPDGIHKKKLKEVSSSIKYDLYLIWNNFSIFVRCKETENLLLLYRIISTKNDMKMRLKSKLEATRV